MSILLTGNTMERITDGLSTLTVNVKLHNSRGRTDINADAEDFYCGLLNIVLDKNLSNLNALQMDFPAIDLADRAARLCVQVTSTEGREKVEHTLEKFYERDMEREFDRLIILIIGEKKKFRKAFPGKGNFRFDPKEDIWDTEKLLSEIDWLRDAEQARVDEYLQKHLKQPQIGPKPLELPLYAALTEDSFVGREVELSLMAEKLERGVKPLVIWGLGGMGKTELVCQFGRSYRGGKVYMARFLGDLRATVADSIAMGIPEVRDRELTPEQRYDLAIARLGQCLAGDILIIDNADLPGGSFMDMKKDPVYRELCALPVQLVFTTRMQDRDGIELKAMENAKLYGIFLRHGVELTAEMMDRLIHSVNAHTMTVDLMARTMDESWETVTPEMILEAMAKSTLPEADYPVIYNDRDDEQRKIYAHLRSLFNLTNIPEDGKQALRCAVLLPEGGMDPAIFIKALPKGPADAIKLLEKQGWVQREKHLLTIHPVVRLVCRTELKPTEKNCRNFLYGIKGQHDPTQYDVEKLRQMAELFENADDMLENETSFWAGEAGCLWNELVEPKRALNCNLRAVEKRERKRPNTNYLAAAYSSMGLTYRKMGDHKLARKYLEKALRIREQRLPKDHLDLAASYNDVGQAYCSLCNYDKALEIELKALDIRERVLNTDHPDLASSYDTVGYTYRCSGECDKALEYTLKAIEIRERILDRDHLDLARSYSNLGITYGKLGDYERSMEYQMKALRIKERVLNENHLSLSTSYTHVGITYGQMGDNGKKLEYSLKALVIRKQILQENSYTLALTFRNVADAYYAMGRIEDAAVHMRRAAEIVNHSTLPKKHKNRVIYNRRAAKLEREARRRAEAE